MMAGRGVRIVIGLAAAAAVACGGSPNGPDPEDGPAVYSITPSIGSTAGGTVVTIRGARFAAGAGVTIGGRAATEVSVEGSDAITATTPPGSGVADVTVTVAGRSGRLRGGFTYLVPPSNSPPSIVSITAQGTRSNEPPDFADAGETIVVSAAVQDDETASDQLEYHWSATTGTFSGAGATVAWQAPGAVETAVDVTITLRVVERYGSGGVFQQDVTGTHKVSLHDSAREVGDMAGRFLTEFSKPQTNKDWQDVMRDFSFDGVTCPHPNEVEDERRDVIDHYNDFIMHDYSIGVGSVQANFGGTCFAGLRADACVAVPVFWDATQISTNTRRPTSGTDHITGVYSRADSRWWLCSSRYQASGSLRHPFYSRR